MMSHFEKYELSHRSGASPRQLFLEARRDGIDVITAIRMLRTVCGLSSEEAKRTITSGLAFDAPQDVCVGATVYWEGSDTVDGLWVVEAKVSEIRDGYVYVTDRKKYLLDVGGLREVDAVGTLERLPLTYFQKSLNERLQASLSFWDQLSAASQNN